MIKTLLSIILCLSSYMALAIDIPKELVVKNEQPGFCAWASLETLANYHGIKELKGLKESRKNPETEEWWVMSKGQKVKQIYTRAYGYDFMVLNELASRNVNFTFQDRGSKEKEILKRANKEGLVIVLKPSLDYCGLDTQKQYFNKCYHAVVLVKYDEDNGFEFVDTNTPGHTIKGQKDHMDWFHKYWSGEAIVFEK